ncbi:Non-specific serine/threonine protein kinase protein [Dioscorea alata]|uniref:Non-specific serine/threonine protein kinase protein n=1 Tax=Dioscorea alata TaxID=55571 RepID=A0ACB7UNX9_DIOAL|nr:Non-specific serine/threonine protein kinase protein [Dioscorea alata]
MAALQLWTFHFLIVQALVLFQMLKKTNSQDSPILLNCPPDSNYTIPSTYKTNLDRLLSNLIVSASESPILFANASIGTVHALAQCRADASIANCTACLNLSISTFAIQCPRQRSAAIRFDLCLVRYSDLPFFSQLSSDTPRIIVNGGNASNPSALNQQLNVLMDEASSDAPKSPERFAVGVRNFSQFEYIFGMVECTRDLSSGDCARCLAEVVSLLPINGFGKIGARVFRINCVARFEIYAFFPFSLLPSPPPGNGPGSTGSRTTTMTDGKSKNGTLVLVIAVVLPLVVVGILLVAAICLYSLWRKRRRAQLGIGETISGECPLFDLGTLKAATNNFSDENKLGEGGFGLVYKGVLSDGHEIAVKRFSWNSEHGVEELRNEVDLLVKLQHRNLVRLLGCCLEEEEKLLVYEYLPNTSLNKYLFGEDLVRREKLNWGCRYKIIEGIG